MLAMGWNIERSKEGEAMFQQREGDKHKKTSDPQVKIMHVHHSVNTSLFISLLFTDFAD